MVTRDVGPGVGGPPDGMHRGWSFLIIPRPSHVLIPILAAGWAVAADGVFARATLAMHFGVVHFKVNSLE